MQINEFLKLLENDGLSGYVNVVKEPEYSKKKLLELQSEFALPSNLFYELYINGLLEHLIPSNKMDDWAYNYQIFIKANGDLNEIQYDEKLEEGGSEFRLLYLLS